MKHAEEFGTCLIPLARPDNACPRRQLARKPMAGAPAQNFARSVGAGQDRIGELLPTQ